MMRPGSAARCAARAGRRGLAAVMVVAVLVAGCTSGDDDRSSDATGTTAPDSTASASTRPGADWNAPSCERGVTDPPEVVPVAGSDSDFDLTSFDGTTIRIHWFPRDADAQSPTVLMGPGWSLPGDTDDAPDAEAGVQGVTSIATLQEAGYNVATWDPRGFGASGGTVSIDSVDHEARDVSALIDWLADRDGVLLDAPGNPRVGMVGMSYGGGIQFVTAASDCRVDVITPAIAWNSLSTSLFPAETFKAGWGDLLVSIAEGADLDPHITSAREDAGSSGVLSQEDREWFVARGPDHLLDQIQIPTLIIQGTVDNLFPLSEGIANYRALSANGIPLAMVWFCGGHGVCVDPADPDDLVSDAVLAWLARYLDGDATAEAVPGFQTTDQTGALHTFDRFPPASLGEPVYAFVDSGSMNLQPEGGSGPLTEVPEGDVIASLAAEITPGPATRGLSVPVTVTGTDRLLLGAPRLELGYTCRLDGEATRPTRIFAQLVDTATDRVLGNQVTPIAITCDGLMHRAQVDMEPVAFAAAEGARLDLQIVATSVAYAQPQMGGSVEMSRVVVTIPTVAD